MVNVQREFIKIGLDSLKYLWISLEIYLFCEHVYNMIYVCISLHYVGFGRHVTPCHAMSCHVLMHNVVTNTILAFVNCKRWGNHPEIVSDCQDQVSTYGAGVQLLTKI